MIAADYVYLARGRMKFFGPRRLTAAGVFWGLYFIFVSAVLVWLHAAGIVLEAAK